MSTFWEWLRNLSSLQKPLKRLPTRIYSRELIENVHELVEPPYEVHTIAKAIEKDIRILFKTKGVGIDVLAETVALRV